MKVVIDGAAVFVEDDAGNEFYQSDGDGEAYSECDERAVKAALLHAVRALDELPLIAVAPRLPLRWMTRR